jgi:serine/threonine protein kinase
VSLPRLDLPGCTGLELDPVNHWVWFGMRGDQPVRVLVVDRRKMPLQAARDAIVHLQGATQHPYAARLLAIEEVGEHQLAVVTEHSPLGTLARVVELSGTASIDEVRRLGADLAEALGHAHRLGIVHGHIGPGSILLGEDRHPRLASHGAIGELEQFLGVRPAPLGILPPEGAPSASADLYSLACTLVFAATGSALASALPEELRDPLETLIWSAPDQRGMGAYELATRLREQLPDEAEVIELFKVPPRRRVSRVLTAGALASVLVIGGGGFALWQRGNNNAEPGSGRSTVTTRPASSATAPRPPITRLVRPPTGQTLVPATTPRVLVAPSRFTATAASTPPPTTVTTTTLSPTTVASTPPTVATTAPSPVTTRRVSTPAPVTTTPPATTPATTPPPTTPPPTTLPPDTEPPPPG